MAAVGERRIYVARSLQPLGAPALLSALNAAAGESHMAVKRNLPLALETGDLAPLLSPKCSNKHSTQDVAALQAAGGSGGWRRRASRPRGAGLP